MLRRMAERLGVYLHDDPQELALFERLAGWHIHFFHEGKAPYPEISAYRQFFGDRCSASEGPESNIPAQADPERLIVWQIMGFYPTRPAARFLVHDYRSLSVGRTGLVKDLIKRSLNATPNLRIYQNDRIRDALGFRDDRGSVIIPMGVPSWIFDLSWREDATEYDFGYVGLITEERGFRKVLRSFIDAYRGTRNLLLIGPADQSIREQFEGEPGLTFTGKLPQKQAIETLLSARCGVALCPGHRPYRWQTPTKLLEYAALGMPVLANHSPMNVKTIELHGIKATLRSDELFGTADIPKVPMMANSVSRGVSP